MNEGTFVAGSILSTHALYDPEVLHSIVRKISLSSLPVQVGIDVFRVLMCWD
jgi:hypothetical protein